MRITNSPGVSMAGTVSLLPVPGTKPPELKPRVFLLNPAPRPFPKPAIPFASFIQANAVSRGIIGLRASATLIKALAKSNVVLTKT